MWDLSLATLVIGSALAAGGQEFGFLQGMPDLRPPILVTTCGQTPGALILALVCDEVGIACVRQDLVYAGDLAADCPLAAETYHAGVLFVTTGASVEGMETAGVDVDSEVARCVVLIERAKELGMVVIVGQIEGPPRRVNEYDETSIQAMSPLADLLITRADVNEDGYFTALAEEIGIPQIFIDETLDLRVLLPLLFPSEDNGDGVPPTC